SFGVPAGAAGAQRLERARARAEQRAGQRVERVPRPAIDLVGLEHTRLSALPVSHKSKVQVMLRRVLANVHHAQEARRADLEPGLFAHLARRAVGERLEVLEVATGPRILAGAVRALAAAEQHAALLEDHHSDSDARAIFRHGSPFYR